MDAVTDQTIYKVIGLLYPNCRSEYHEFDSMRELYVFLMTQSESEASRWIPYYFLLEDGTTLPYVHQFFHQAFTLDMYTEAELKEMIEFSGI